MKSLHKGSKCDQSRITAGHWIQKSELVWKCQECQETKNKICPDCGNIFEALALTCCLPAAVLESFDPHVLQPAIAAGKQQPLNMFFLKAK
jgi:hypothetical protein